MAKRSAPEVNAGSMADIAFLLLIFFLVTTTIETDTGLNRKLPPIDDTETEPPIIKQKNIFTVQLNRNNQLLVEEQLMELKDLRKAAVEFLDNGGGTGTDGCTYCKGKRDPASSDNPDKAIISLKNDRETKYGIYISVQNELVAAYNQLRDRRAMELYGKTLKEMEANYADVNWIGNKDDLKEKIEKVKIEYPQKLSEVQ
ncbi:biopolymer transporter ExbD [Gelidibacter salicanalis]|uniref:Biopolymer transporter ExbD n=1 Tax=Gelidibacter salicanalis TaxID=291193 RepID=A0A5C7AI79_9FLAO|nr:biopolymer transporter ExbD [Gelidibacter salicanalis]TXE08131.1 biopolymer transporter ExbD [Gelidibacter salicanalis]